MFWIKLIESHANYHLSDLARMEKTENLFGSQQKAAMNRCEPGISLRKENLAKYLL